MKFFARFSKAIGALGGSGVGSLISWGFAIVHHPLDSTVTSSLPIVGAVIATVLAPPNSITDAP
jgi:hypothetical protein